MATQVVSIMRQAVSVTIETTQAKPVHTIREEAKLKITQVQWGEMETIEIQASRPIQREVLVIEVKEIPEQMRIQEGIIAKEPNQTDVWTPIRVGISQEMRATEWKATAEWTETQIGIMLKEWNLADNTIPEGQKTAVEWTAIPAGISPEMKTVPTQRPEWNRAAIVKCVVKLHNKPIQAMAEVNATAIKGAEDDRIPHLYTLKNTASAVFFLFKNNLY